MLYMAVVYIAKKLAARIATDFGIFLFVCVQDNVAVAIVELSVQVLRP